MGLASYFYRFLKSAGMGSLYLMRFFIFFIRDFILTKIGARGVPFYVSISKGGPLPVSDSSYKGRFNSF